MGYEKHTSMGSYTDQYRGSYTDRYRGNYTDKTQKEAPVAE